MKKSKLKPFVRTNLEILFVGLNPAKGSSDKGHYFSVNQAFWNQLHESGLIKENIDKSFADDCVFAGNTINFNNWNYGITDLVTKFAESNSRKIIPTLQDCKRLKKEIIKFRPGIAILLHKKVLEYFLPFIDIQVKPSNSGSLGKLIADCETEFYNIAFPHGNSISSELKVQRYKEVKEKLLKRQKENNIKFCPTPT